MKPLTLIESYFAWHYGRAFADMFHVWMNFLRFVFNFFSLSVLVKTLFDPWKRMGEAYPKGFDIVGIASTFLINMLMRFVGVMMRLIVIGIGLSLALAVFIIGLLAGILWALLPVVFVSLVILALHLIFYA